MDLFDKPLPKWPQMIVTGKTISETDALEIIRRTDIFIADPKYNGHDKEFSSRAIRILKYPDYDYGMTKVWLKDWGFISLEYIYNDWINSSYAGGAHGWCHPDGTIGYAENIGKWPEIQEVFSEWKIIAEAFPFLELEVTLMNGEYCDQNIKPVVSFLIRNGSVEIVDPDKRNLHAEFFRTMPEKSNSTLNLVMVMSGNYALSNKIPIHQIQCWAEKFLSEKNRSATPWLK